MIIEKFIAKGSDNYNYIVADETTKKAIVIDPLDTKEVAKRIARHKYQIEYILNTHSHLDHTAGNISLQNILSVPIAGCGSHDYLDVKLNHEDTLSAGSLQIKTIHTPGHIADACCYYIGNHIFTGDTVFLSGAGNCYSGKPDALFESFNEKILTLPDETIMHVGHEYAERNLLFAIDIEKNNSATEKKLKAIKNKKITQSTIREEKKYNPFFRYANASYKKALEKKIGKNFITEREIFLATRELRNHW